MEYCIEKPRENKVIVAAEASTIEASAQSKWYAIRGKGVRNAVIPEKEAAQHSSCRNQDENLLINAAGVYRGMYSAYIGEFKHDHKVYENQSLSTLW